MHNVLLCGACCEAAPPCCLCCRRQVQASMRWIAIGSLRTRLPFWKCGQSTRNGWFSEHECHRTDSERRIDQWPSTRSKVPHRTAPHRTARPHRASNSISLTNLDETQRTATSAASASEPTPLTTELFTVLSDCLAHTYYHLNPVTTLHLAAHLVVHHNIRLSLPPENPGLWRLLSNTDSSCRPWASSSSSSSSKSSAAVLVFILILFRRSPPSPEPVPLGSNFWLTS